MCFPIIFALLAVAPFVIHGQQIAEECSGAPGWSKYEGSCYKVFSSNMNYTTAKRVCQLMNSNVVSIHSADENDFVARLSYNDFKLCQGRLEPLPNYKDPKFTEGIDEHYCKKQGNDYMDSYFIGLHRKLNNSTGHYVNNWEDNNTTSSFGNHPEVLPKPAPNSPLNPGIFPWHAGQPSGYTSYDEGYLEECTSMVDPCGQWNDLMCDYPHESSGVVCEKRA